MPLPIDADHIEYREGDGKLLQETFIKVDSSNEYVLWDKLQSWQQRNWENIAKEFLNNI